MCSTYSQCPPGLTAGLTSSLTPGLTAGVTAGLTPGLTPVQNKKLTISSKQGMGEAT